MVLKLNISEKGKTYKLEVETELFSGKSIGDKFDGREINSDLDGCELEITGGSDIAGFPMKSDVEGIGLGRAVLIRGWGMHNKRKGIRLRKTVRGKVIGEKTVQVNLNVVKAGVPSDEGKKLSDIFGGGEAPTGVPHRVGPEEGGASTSSRPSSNESVGEGKEEIVEVSASLTSPEKSELKVEGKREEKLIEEDKEESQPEEKNKGVKEKKVEEKED